MHFVMTIALWNKIDAICNKTRIYNKKTNTFCNKLLSHFVIIKISIAFLKISSVNVTRSAISCSLCSESITMNQIWDYNHYWLPKLDFLVASTKLMLFPMSHYPSSFEGQSISANLHEKNSRTAWNISAWNLGTVNKTFYEAF